MPIIGVLLLFAVFNIVTAPYSPDPWLDEVSYTDPGASLAVEGSFTSDVWGDRGSPIWTGNVPLHQLLLAGCFKVFGFSCRVARSANVIYYTLAIFLICQMVGKYHLVGKAGARWLLLLILLTGTGLTALYRNGRYDALGMLLFVGWIFCSLHSLRRPWLLSGVVLAAGLMPAAGLALAPMLFLSCVTAFLLWRWQVWRVMVATGIGGISGLAILQLTYQRLGVPHIFREVMKAAGGNALQLDFTVAVFKNPSYLAAMLAGALILFVLRRSGPREAQIKLALALTGLGLVVPFFCALVAKYNLNYSWMAIIPATLGACMILEQPSVPRLARVAGIVLLVLATLPGFPRRAVRIASAWMQERPAAIAQYVIRNTSPADTVFVDINALAGYYDLRFRAHKSYWIVPPKGEADGLQVTTAIMSGNGCEAQLGRMFSGAWLQVDDREFGTEKIQVFPEPPVRLVVYRRVQPK